ncbi:MAG TPA: T9SS type A sorting domain-containing protein, partial [Flavobacteriales bacterium]|nr:T9SS type A sorting domain-containing protein [Flavobacteriales bacterium]
TFRFEGASHPCTWFVQEGVVHVVFDNIILPDSAADEPGSHGFARFTIVPVSTLAPGATVGNVANIYFDFNEPVITAPAVLTIELSTGVDASVDNGLNVFPVPTTGAIQVRVAEEQRGSMLRVIDALGRCVLRMPLQGTIAAISLDALPAGTYVLQADGANGTWQARVVKQ